MGLPVSIEAAFVMAFENDAVLGPAFTKEGEDARIFAASSLGEGDGTGANPPAPDFPYLMWNELPSTPHQQVRETASSQWRFFTFHVYDEEGSSITINKLLRRIRKVLNDLYPYETLDPEDGEADRCIEIRWEGFSGLIHDPAYHSSVRFGTARFQTSN